MSIMGHPCWFSGSKLETRVNTVKLINFVAPANTQEAYDLLVHCSFAGFDYNQTKRHMKELGYYVPEDMYIAFTKVLDISTDLRYRLSIARG